MDININSKENLETNGMDKSKQLKAKVRRGLANLIANNEENLPTEYSSVYGDKIKEFRRVKQIGFLQPKYFKLNEDNVAATTESNSKLAEEPKTTSSQNCNEPIALRRSPRKKASNKVHRVNIDEDSQNVVTLDESDIRDRSPSPPPQHLLQSTHIKKNYNDDIDQIIRQLDYDKQMYAASHNHLTAQEVDCGTHYVDSDDDDDVICEDAAIINDNNDNVVVKIRWRMNVIRFPMKKAQRFQVLFSHLANEYNVSESQILLTLNDSVIIPEHTPKSLQLKITDIIEGGVLIGEKVILPSENRNLIELKILSSLSKIPKLIKVNKDEPFSNIMEMFAKDNNIPIAKLAFKFDGENVDFDSTPEDLDIEDGMCIDAVIKN